MSAGPSVQMKAGVVMNVACLLVLQLSINTWARAYFHLDEFPLWARAGYHQLVNATSAALPAVRES